MSDNNDFAGFEDILDLLDEKRGHSSKRNEDLYKEHEMVSFLDQNKERLKKIDNLITKKYHIVKEHQNSQGSLGDAKITLRITKNTLIKKLYPKSSALNQELKIMWNSIFK